MTEVAFYHLQRDSLDTALPRLLQKVYERGLRAVVLAGSDDRVAALNDRLWTYSRDGFLPHGALSDGYAADQPIFLTTEEVNPNQASVLVMVDGAEAGYKGGFERCLDMFDGNDPAAVDAARGRWRACREAGFAVTYWQQGDNGWQREA